MIRKGILVALSLLSASCSDEEPAGQVIARVNGVDITRRELLTEMRALDLPATTEVSAVQDELLARLVDRKLMAAKARDALIDRSPDYQALRRRSDEVLLADQLAVRLGAMTAQPSTEAVDRFVAENPQMFAQRQIVSVEQITFPRNMLTRLPKLQSMASVDAMAQALDRAGASYQRGPATLDTRALDREAARRLDAQGAGSPSLSIDGQLATARFVLARRTMSTGVNEQRAAATDLLARRAQQATFSVAVAELRKNAKITYQQGYAPHR
ncbi:hypothetical protein [Novosphingobium album (ex Hu et al. 2023)]|uniref:Peptidyl-prolyl cis-trans isomerase, EpsD family n=1 Tax=Novosphingobium album (ex Hu et al. 2023) TaxID=2930093 RepID=A0ABT0B4U2_9SPHN|nr:hypothetical protein [Novosphingobium album (ex Hu et al. 2023)]MCJ2180056.1 hypothetical protein [Novosphingobium album (ex Hu et al. 2023)]